MTLPVACGDCCRLQRPSILSVHVDCETRVCTFHVISHVHNNSDPLSALFAPDPTLYIQGLTLPSRMYSRAFQARDCLKWLTHRKAR